MMGMTNPETVHYGMWDGSSIVICAYALTLILIYVKRKEYPQAFLLFAPASVLFLAVIYCPPFYAHLPRTADGDQRQVFRRFRWILMMLPVLAFSMTCIVATMKKKQKAIFAVVCAMLVAISVFYTSDGREEYGFWDRTEAQDHLYKIPLFVISMGDTIMEQNEDYLSKRSENVVSMLVIDDDEDELLGSPTYLMRQLRTYISPIKCTIVKGAVSGSGVALVDGSQERTADATDVEYDYVLCFDRKELVSGLVRCGFSVESTGEGCAFLSRRRK